MSVAYYNENDPKAAAWLCELIKQGHIAPGVVDTRSIEDVRPVELAGFTQCHFFAGIGGWSLALRLAGWPDDRPVWTGSCPCQPFSAAGKRTGTSDDRHLWPHFHWLIKQCRPVTVFGEQVASKDGLDWLDIVQADLENSDYTSGAVDLCAAGFGAPHIRQRLFWVANAKNYRDRRDPGKVFRTNEELEAFKKPGEDETRQRCDSGSVVRVADANNAGSQRREGVPERANQCTTGSDRLVSGLANTKCEQREERIPRPGESNQTERGGETIEPTGFCLSIGMAGKFNNPNPTNGFWGAVDWLGCRDGKWRPVEPGTFPLADGIPARVVRLRGYGNAIVPQVAAAFIEAAL